MDVARSAPQGFTTMRTLFTCSLNWELKREHGVSINANTVLGQHFLYPGEQHTIGSYIKPFTMLH